jgi:hypothetical protein
VKKEKLLIIFGVVFTALLVAFNRLYSETDFYGTAMDVLTVLLAAFCLFATLTMSLKLKKLKQEEWRVFFYVAIAMALWSVAEAIWGYYEVFVGESPALSAADFFWLIAYPPFIYGLFLSFEHIRSYISAALLASVSFLLVGSISVFYLWDAMLSTEEDFLVNLVNAAYILGDSLLIAFSVPVIFASITRPIGLSWFLIGAATILGAVGDISFFYFAALEQYSPSLFVSLFYLFDYVWIAIGASIYLRGESTARSP